LLLAIFLTAALQLIHRRRVRRNPAGQTAGIESVRRLINPVPIEHVGWVALAGLVGFIGDELVAVYRIRVGRTQRRF
jgi:hypothetical protein